MPLQQHPRTTAYEYFRGLETREGKRKKITTNDYTYYVRNQPLLRWGMIHCHLMSELVCTFVYTRHTASRLYYSVDYLVQ